MASSIVSITRVACFASSSSVFMASVVFDLLNFTKIASSSLFSWNNLLRGQANKLNFHPL